MLTLFISFFIADVYKAQSLSRQIPDDLPSNLFIAEGIIFIIINFVVFFFTRKYPKSVALTTVAMILMVMFEMALASLNFVW